ncbi:hypothetical protein PQZ37_01235 [bacterium]|jgi:hypothetical protein|nr:hypothetical protein [bacterium]|tara:strand:- start:188 stop:586 length:399 start_codon:yes stop_codon:yes gene_type:complete
MSEPKKENRGGARVHHAGYRKVRVEMFAMVEQLICSSAILTASLQHNEVLQRKAHLTRNNLRDKVAAQDALEFILREKIEKLEEKIAVLSERMMSVHHLQEQIDYLKKAEIEDGFNDAKTNTTKIRKKRRPN